LLRGRPGERPGADDTIARVPPPQGDPIFGANGALTRLWAL